MNEERVQSYRAVERRLWDHYGATPREHFFDLATPRVRVRVQEIGAGPPVLFVHGGPNAGSTWAALVAHLQDFRCLMLDRPGCGLSEAVDYAAYSARDLPSLAADVLTSVLDALGIERLAIVGSSLGGAFAFWLAEARPERVVRVVQEGLPAFVEGQRTPLFMRMLMVPPLGRMIARQRSTATVGRFILRQIGHGASLDAGRFPPVFLDWYLHLMNDTETMRNDVAVIQMLSTWRGPRSELIYGAEFLRRLRQPTLFLWGEADSFGGVEVGRRAAAAVPDATFKSFAASGHLPWLDDPETHARLVRDFLQADAA